jgi:hypothetical protein
MRYIGDGSTMPPDDVGSNSATAAGTSQSYRYPPVWGVTHGMEGVRGFQSHPVHHPHAARTPASTCWRGFSRRAWAVASASWSRHDPQCALLTLPAVGSRPYGVVSLGHGQQVIDGGEAGAVRRRCAGERRASCVDLAGAVVDRGLHEAAPTSFEEVSGPLAPSGTTTDRKQRQVSHRLHPALGDAENP